MLEVNVLLIEFLTFIQFSAQNPFFGFEDLKRCELGSKNALIQLGEE